MWWRHHTIRLSPLRKTALPMSGVQTHICSDTRSSGSLCRFSCISSLRRWHVQSGWKCRISAIFSSNADESIHPLPRSPIDRRRCMACITTENQHDRYSLGLRVWWKVARSSGCVFHSSECDDQRKSLVVVHPERNLWGDSSGSGCAGHAVKYSCACGSSQRLERVNCHCRRIALWEHSAPTMFSACRSTSETITPAAQSLRSNASIATRCIAFDACGKTNRHKDMDYCAGTVGKTIWRYAERKNNDPDGSNPSLVVHPWESQARMETPHPWSTAIIRLFNQSVDSKDQQCAGRRQQ